VGRFTDMKNACEAVLELRKLPELPSAIEMVDGNLLNLVGQLNPNQLRDVIEAPIPQAVLLVEFDSVNERIQKRLVKKAAKVLERFEAKYSIETDPIEQEKFWKIRHASATIAAHGEGNLKAVPIIEDGVVPVEKLEEYIKAVYALFDKHHLTVALWGHAGDANLHLHPFLDLSQLGDRQKLFKLMDEYYALVLSLGGSTTGEHGDGRLRGPYLPKLYGNEVYALFQKVKQIFDPYGTLNPGVKIDVKLDDVKSLLRQEYSMEHLSQYLLHS
jgi:FAD/FMN-containing dehydrogenase